MDSFPSPSFLLYRRRREEKITINHHRKTSSFIVDEQPWIESIHQEPNRVILVRWSIIFGWLWATTGTTSLYDGLVDTYQRIIPWKDMRQSLTFPIYTCTYVPYSEQKERRFKIQSSRVELINRSEYHRTHGFYQFLVFLSLSTKPDTTYL